jgi:AraC-like DNA-binding protein
MSSKLDTVTDWPGLAEKHGYRVGMMAVVLGVSERWLRVYLKREFGKRPHELLSQWRFERIQILARAGAVGDGIAREVQFSDCAHLCRSLKAEFGVSLSEIRAQQ